MKEYSVYFDEYGNTGNNLLDINQPYYIVCGWIIPNVLKNRITQSIKDDLRDYNPSLKELKGKKLLQSSKGRKFLCQLLMQMLNSGCIPILSINYKGFVAAAKLSYLLEDCIDSPILHNYNLIISAKERNRFAHLLLELCPEEVSEFAALSREPVLEKIKSLFQKIHLNLSEKGSEFAPLFKDDIVDFEQALWSLSNDLTSQPRKAASAINLPCFITLLSILEDLGRINNLKIDVYHDEVIQFKEAYQNYSEYMNNGSDFHLQLDNGFTAWYDLKHTLYKGMKKSNEDPLIQSADLLCSAIQALIVDYKDTEIINDLAIVGLMGISIAMNYNTLHYMMVNNNLQILMKNWKEIVEEEFNIGK